MSNVVPASWRMSLEDLRDRISWVIDRWLPYKPKRALAAGNETWPSFLSSATGPAITVANGDDEVLVYAELPGMSRKEFKVEMDGQRLILSGEKKRSWTRRGRSFEFEEKACGAFYRTIPLPCAVQPDRIKASYKGGILKVRLPKTEEAKKHCVRVTVQ